jgi:hypothetical protein
LVKSAPVPLAVLLLPVMLPKSANAPFAVFLTPAVLFKSAAAPVAVGKERSSAETSVELAFCVAPEREEIYRRIESAGRKTEQCSLPFGRVASWIAPVGRWDNSLALRGKTQSRRATALRRTPKMSV